MAGTAEVEDTTGVEVMKGRGMMNDVRIERIMALP